jgi:hypothetical protein
MTVLQESAARQDPLVAIAHCVFSDFDEDNILEMVTVPAGAIIIGGSLNISAVFDDDANFLVGKTGDTDALSGSVDADALGDTALAGADVNQVLTAKTTYGITSSDTALAKGAATLIVMYVVDGRAHSTQD